MSNYIYTCACCGTQWDRTSTGRYPTPKELAGMVCQPCREAPKRIAALEAEAQRWRKAHDKIIAYAADVEERAKESIAEAAAENAVLREDKVRLDWLLENVDGDRDTERIGAWLWDIAASLCPLNYDEADNTQRWGRAAIDAARKETL